MRHERAGDGRRFTRRVCCRQIASKAAAKFGQYSQMSGACVRDCLCM